ncbi:hypothetical protein ACWDBO_37470 [Streptomyces mirabilis]|uniref:hypothetical protein n=1 Tax=Streptomyces mirabilis TaxID=68239 RepID=UPI00332948CA
MTQRSHRPHIIAGAAGGGVLVGSVAVEAADSEESWSPDFSGVLPMLCVTTIAVTTLKRWLNNHEARTRASIEEFLTIRHQARERELDEREQAVARREKRIDRREYIATLRVRSVAHRLDLTLDELARQRMENEQLRNDYREVAADHDKLIQQLILDGADRFTRRGEGTVRIPGPAGNDSGPRRSTEHRRGPSSLAVVPAREHHESM